MKNSVSEETIALFERDEDYNRKVEYIDEDKIFEDLKNFNFESYGDGHHSGVAIYDEYRTMSFDIAEGMLEGDLIVTTNGDFCEAIFRYVAGVPDGVSVKFYISGNRYKEFIYKEGDIKQCIIYDDDTGIIYTILNLSNYIHHGDELVFHEDGNLKYKSFYINGKQERDCFRFYDQAEGGSIEIHSYVKDDKFEGKSTEYYPNGALKSEYNYIDGMIEGKRREYYESGALKEERECKNDMIDGIVTSYYENGNVESKELYKNNHIEGTGYFYYENGALKKEANYKEGVKDGVSKVYYESGALKEEATYKQGLLVGEGRTYFESGALKAVEKSIEGASDMKYEEYYENGKLFATYEVENDVYNGECRKYYESGNLQILCDFKNNLIQKGVKYADQQEERVIATLNPSDKQKNTNASIVEFYDDGSPKVKIVRTDDLDLFEEEIPYEDDKYILKAIKTEFNKDGRTHETEVNYIDEIDRVFLEDSQDLISVIEMKKIFRNFGNIMGELNKKLSQQNQS